ncbi:unnamed protein product, partial [Ectocarpus sp. 12 AP-2014]
LSCSRCASTQGQASTMKNKGNAKKASKTAERRGAPPAAAATTRTAGSGGQQADRANGRGIHEAKPGQAGRGNGKGSKAKDEVAAAMEERDQDSSEELSNGSSSDEGDDEDESEDGEEEEDDDGSDDDDDDDDDSGEESEEFEDQGSDSDDSEEMERQQAEAEEDSDDDEGKGGGSGKMKLDESTRQTWSMSSRDAEIKAQKGDGALAVSMAMHTDDLSSDDDEENRNTVGRVPLHWYDEYDHIGYDRSGGKVMKSADGTGNGIDAALNARDDPNYARTVYDAYNDREVTLTDRELEVIRRIQAGAFPHPEFQAYPDYVDYFTHEKQVMPLEGGDEPKRRFIPSKWEMMKVHQLMKGIREGRIVVNPKKMVEEDSYAIWKDDDDIPEKHRGPMHIPAPKIPLPGHAESYRPPKEYLLTEEEQKQWEEMDPSERPTNFIPKSFDSLREVGAYGGFVKERFERCLDLYLCPRAFKRRLNIDPESLVPRLPRPRELKPFPNALCVEYKGHAASVRCIACSGDGQWMATGDDNGVLVVWEVDTARAAQRFDLSGYGGIGAMEGVAGKKGPPVKWEALVAATAKGKGRGRAAGAEGSDGEVGPRVVLRCEREVCCVTWHGKGDYLASVSRGEDRRAVMIHQVSKASTQCPFRKTKGEVQCVKFHVSKPFLFVATKQQVRIYHLIKQMLVKKLISGCKWISCIDVHPSGDHLIVGSYDRRVAWFDLDLASTPYKTLKYHTR